MGNAIGLRSRRSVRLMTVDGAKSKLRAPCMARDAVADRGEGYCVMESEDVKKNGVHARRLDPDASLKPGKLYFLVHLPKPAAAAGSNADPRRVQSSIQMSAKDRLETLMLSRRRAVSDITSFTRVAAVDGTPTPPRCAASGEIGEGVRVTMRLPRAEVKRLVRESADSAEAARKIAELARSRIGEAAAGGGKGGGGGGGADQRDVSGNLSGNLSSANVSGNLSECSGNLGVPAGTRKKKMRFSPLQPEIIG